MLEMLALAGAAAPAAPAIQNEATRAFLDACLDIALILLSISFFIAIIRVVIGPTIVDRVLALDMLVGIAIGYIAVFGLRTGFTLYIDIAIALGLVGFLATVAFARFILHRGEPGITPGAEDPDPMSGQPENGGASS